jgi:hypothetical protein
MGRDSVRSFLFQHFIVSESACVLTQQQLAVAAVFAEQHCLRLSR